VLVVLVIMHVPFYEVADFPYLANYAEDTLAHDSVKLAFDPPNYLHLVHLPMNVLLAILLAILFEAMLLLQPEQLLQLGGMQLFELSILFQISHVLLQNLLYSLQSYCYIHLDHSHNSQKDLPFY
jgi:hypothetical protein